MRRSPAKISSHSAGPPRTTNRGNGSRRVSYPAAPERLTAVPGVSLRFAQPFFKEFTLRLPKSPERVAARLARQKILAGLPLKPFDRRHGDCLLVAVTEKRTKDEIDAFADALTTAVA